MRISFVWILILLIPFAGIAQPKAKKEKKPLETALNTPARRAKNVILLIGDGMGLTQISSGLYNNNNALSLERFPFTGLQKTHASDDLITDSAAAGTAIACGVKTKVGAIGVGKDNKPARSLMEEAEAKGMATGMVVTSSLVDATPSAFVAHVPSRDQKEDIAKSYLNIDIDFLVGGGGRILYPAKKRRPGFGEGIAGKRLCGIGLHRIGNPQGDPGSEKKLCFFHCGRGPCKFQESRSYLLPASRLGAVFLKGHNDKGFFLMVEGSQIDWGGHANDASYVVAEFLEFDRVIGSLLEFAMEDGETLVIVTADDETVKLVDQPRLPSMKPAHGIQYQFPYRDYGPGVCLWPGSGIILWNLRQHGNQPPHQKSVGLGVALTGAVRRGKKNGQAARFLRKEILSANQLLCTRQIRPGG